MSKSTEMSNPAEMAMPEVVALLGAFRHLDRERAAVELARRAERGVLRCASGCGQYGLLLSSYWALLIPGADRTRLAPQAT